MEHNDTSRENTNCRIRRTLWFSFWSQTQKFLVHSMETFSNLEHLTERALPGAAGFLPRHWDIEFYKINIVTSVTPKNFSTHFPDMSWVCKSLQMIISIRRSKRGDHMRRRKNSMVANVRYWRFLKIDTNFSKTFSGETSKSSVLPSRQGGFNRF